MIKILHFVSKMDRAGQETFIMNVYKNINRNKFQFCFLCTNTSHGDYDDEIYELGGKIFYLPNNLHLSGLKRYLSKVNVLSRWLQNNCSNFDIVHLHTYHALDVFVHLEACRRAGITKIFVHSHNTNGPHHAIHYIFRFFNNKFYKYKKLACAYDAGLWLFGKRIMKAGNIPIIYNGIDPKEYQYNEIIREKYRNRFDIEKKMVIGHVGRFSLQKNHSFIIDVFDRYMNINIDSVLVLVGKGELENEIKNKVNNLGCNKHVLFLGSRDDVSKLMSMMDILIFPSHHEGLSVVLVEAQAAGLKCLVSDDIVPDEELVIPELFVVEKLSESSEQWANTLRKMSSIVIDRRKCNSIIVESNFNIQVTVTKIENEYETILKKS